MWFQQLAQFVDVAIEVFICAFGVYVFPEPLPDFFTRQEMVVGFNEHTE